MRRNSWPLGRGRWLPAGGSTLIMGILNLTPDSFSDGSALPDVASAKARARELLRAGADILDLGGESTRPGAEEVPAAVECERVLPVLRALREISDVPISVDTRKAEVWAEAYAAGADLLNDVSGLAFDPELGAEAAAGDAAVILMHMRGTPADMDQRATYDDPVQGVREELVHALDRARMAGIDEERCVLDPGIGFAKTAEQSLALLRDLDALRMVDCPLLVGVSRKRLIGTMTGEADPKLRDPGSAALAGWLAGRGVECVRVHEPGPTRQAIAVHEALAGHTPTLPSGKAS